MPKNTKKRKAKAADFTKAKLKLGKGKQGPSNVIDTSFKARSIALPTQGIALEKDADVPTTKRKLTFGALISHLQHYNSSTRKDAIIGLRELLEAYPEVLGSSVSPLINAVARVINDEDASVRKTLLSFFAWLLPQVPSEDIIPHSPSLILFITSAQTHIFPEIRIDAVRFLTLLLDYIPEIITDGWSQDRKSHGSRVLEGYLGILNAGTAYNDADGPPQATSASSVVLKPASKLVVVQSLSAFIQQALHLPSKRSETHLSLSIPTRAWYMENSFNSKQAYESFETLLCPSTHHLVSSSRLVPWQSQIEIEDDIDSFIQNYTLLSSSTVPWVLQDLTKVGDITEGGAALGSSHKDTDISFLAHLARTLQSVLVAIFLDYAPSAFSPNGSSSDTEVQLVLSVAQIARSIYGAILQTPGKVPGAHIEDLQSILGYMAPYFPFVLDGSKDIKHDQASQELNLIFCELTALLHVAGVGIGSTPTPVTSRRGRLRNDSTCHCGPRHATNKDALAIQTRRVSRYVLQLLHGEATTAHLISQALSPTTYLALLPTVWVLIDNNIDGATTEDIASGASVSEVLDAVLDHALKTASRVSVKHLTINFVARLVLLDTDSQYIGQFRLGRDAAEDAKFRAWLLHLPQVLWEMGIENLPATETILRALLRILQRRSKLIRAETISALRSRLIPYFGIMHHIHGRVSGPYAKLLPSSASPARRLVLDLVATLGEHIPDGAPAHKLVEGRCLEDGLSAAVEQAVAGTEEESYWIHVKAVLL